MSDDVSTNLVLNFSPLHFDDVEVQVGIVEYQGREHLRTLRSRHNATHVFYREEGTRILCVPIVPDAPEIGNCSTTIRLADNLYLSAALVRNALINYFHTLGQQILTYNPIKFIAVGSSNNLLAASVPKGVPCPPELSVRLLYEMNVRVFKLDHQKPFIGLALDVRTARLIKYPCDKLIDEGLSLNGLYVGRFVPRDDARMASRFELLGRVQNIHQKQLFLGDERPGFASIYASEVVLEPRYRAFDAGRIYAPLKRCPRVSGKTPSPAGPLFSKGEVSDESSPVIYDIKLVSHHLGLRPAEVRRTYEALEELSGVHVIVERFPTRY